VVEDNTINDGGRCILVEITMSDFDIQAVMLDAVQCILLFYQILDMSIHILVTGLFKFVMCIVNGIMISKCSTMDFNGIMEFKLCVKDKSILNVYLLFSVLHYVSVSRKYPALMGFDICN
jgi:hypothetical protein